MKPTDRVRWVYASQSNTELARRYDAWAASYDHDLVHIFGRVVLEPFVELVLARTRPAMRILDAGAGTGLVGAYLHQQGYGGLVAMDLSAGMLAEARKTGAYRALHQMTLGEPLDFDDDHFDAIIASGVFTEGHAPPRAFAELIRVTRPGGLILFTLQPRLYSPGPFGPPLEQLVAEGRWTLLERGEPYQALPLAEPDILLEAWCFQVNPQHP